MILVVNVIAHLLNADYCRILHFAQGPRSDGGPSCAQFTPPDPTRLAIAAVEVAVAVAVAVGT